MALSAMGWLQSTIGVDITGEWNSLVNFNVGGCSFSCQRRTFKSGEQSSILCKMALTSDRSVPRTEDGSIVIDRDPETFRHVLNFLRSQQKSLMLPDTFSEWDMLLDDARVYELPALADAVRATPKYQQRCFQQSLPPGVMLRWTDGDSSAATAAAAGDSTAKDSTKDETAKSTARTASIEVFPPLQHFGVDPSSGVLHFQNRPVPSVDEAVSILLFTYNMHIETWHRDTIHGTAHKRIAHTVFLTRKQS